MADSSTKNSEVENWWDNNPFTLGVSGSDYLKEDLVGRVPEEKLTLEYFNEIERRWRKHTKDGAQHDGEPVLSMLVDYDFIKGKKVLDIAVGSGFSLVSFAKGGAQVTGIDLTDYAILESKANLKVRGLTGEVMKMDAQKMTFQNESFDFVDAWGCLMHMPETEKAISEIYRVLKPGGQALAYMYNKSSWPYWFNYFFVKGILMLGLVRFKGDMVRLTSRYSDGYTKGGNPLAKFYTPKEVKKMFEDAGFREVQSFPFEIPYEPDGWPMRVFPVFKFLPKKIKSYMAKNWGYGLIVKAKK